MTSVDVHYLQILSLATLKSKALPEKYQDRVQLIEAQRPQPELNRYLYAAVGGDWYWTDRLSWSYQQWLDAISGPNHRTFICYLDGTPAGYFELHKHPQADVEISYFGLLPDAYGLGLGGWLLTRCIQEAFDWGASKVWVHTCTLDHPAAMANYKARGMWHYHTEKEQRDTSQPSPGPWQGANRPRIEPPAR
ncbi:GNAT family N-acetyltransferase [Permianibacter aggregans]|uniref:Acetyltransferase (GNAT) family protein n=1 Tax=Permianibacter aggregans TaxID=1510150 RepID=A0A4R6UIR6_9GAMM|nr:GNAT family N-acetyltransferase [Permianibacter aggregans]QGX38964.1 GNAT family N-acetyltransferase [Permianibacter aggregans]TDQ46788.1 acetyltransferase (GNAT) family protein [Permianibacter aggregans]